MQLPTPNTPVDRCAAASAFTVGALRAYPTMFGAPADVAAKLENFAGSLESSTTALTAAQSAYRTAVLAVVPTRVGVKLVDLRSADVVRSVKRAAEDAGADIAEAVFPGGVMPIIKPFGQTEVDGLRKLEGRIEAASGWDGREAQLARVSEVRGAYETALENRKDAMMAASAQRALRDAAKEDFLDTFAEVASSVKATFPRDRPRQDVFFDTIHARRSASDDAEQDDHGGDTDEPVAPPV